MFHNVGTQKELPRRVDTFIVEGHLERHGNRKYSVTSFVVEDSAIKGDLEQAIVSDLEFVDLHVHSSVVPVWLCEEIANICEAMVLDHGYVNHVRDRLILNHIDNLVLNHSRNESSKHRHDHVNHRGDDASPNVELHLQGIKLKVADRDVHLRNDSCLVFLGVVVKPCKISSSKLHLKVKIDICNLDIESSLDRNEPEVVAEALRPHK